MSNGPGVLEKTSSTLHHEATPQMPEHETVEEIHERNKRLRRSFKQLFPQYIVLPHLVTKSLILVGFVIFLVTLSYQWIYAGFLWNPLGRITHLEVALINQDKGFDLTGASTQTQQLIAGLFSGNSAGALVTSTIMNPELPLNHVFSWSNLPEATTRDQAIETINHGDYWALLYIPSNFPQNFYSAANPTARAPWEFHPPG
ncbi:hypothetical protein K7432_016396 [Basidiobolus ranarum]|uniref:DUF3533 domain-containing protein n=1 Tax=Basidiobolus ranarum TaxID=34480 RepID=A0ABR2WET4_9FUNG